MKQINFDSFIVIDIGIFCLSYNVFSYIFHINKEGRHCNIVDKRYLGIFSLSKGTVIPGPVILFISFSGVFCTLGQLNTITDSILPLYSLA